MDPSFTGFRNFVGFIFFPPLTDPKFYVLVDELPFFSFKIPSRGPGVVESGSP